MSVLDYLTNCSIISTIQQKDDMAGWLAARSKGIGGSDVGAICGVNKYSSARLLYLKKTGQYEDDFAGSTEASERMHFGHVLEPIVADEYSRRTNKKVVESPATLQHNMHTWALANVDRFIVDDMGVPYGVLECKTAGAHFAEDWEEGIIPLYYLYQLQWYLFVTGLRFGAICCLVGGNKFYFYEVYADDELMHNTIFPACKKFWNYNVAEMVEPDISGSDADTDYLKSRYSSVAKNSEVAMVEDEFDDLAQSIVVAKKQIKELERNIEGAANRIKEKMQSNEIGYTANHIIKWSARTQSRVDVEALKIDFPDIYERVLRKSSYRVFTIK